ncbi:MAG TPA: hypothetical protein VFJ78_00295 [Gaiellaceae bacterium]|nr:hypothetical protein [Gaiellaceae bacterium]
MIKTILRWAQSLGFATALAVVLAVAAFGAVGASPIGDGDTPTLAPGAAPLALDEEQEHELLELDLAMSTRRTAGDVPLDNQQAGALRAEAARAAARIRKEGLPTSGPATFTGSWKQIGPNPIVQQTRSSGGFAAMSGRIGALAIRPSTGQFVLGAAQGGIWLYDPATGTWSSKSDSEGTQSIGALAIAPSNDSIIYAGTGEGALSGDSYFGDGVLKSTDGGNTWSHVSGDYFSGVAISRMVVDPTNAAHVFAAVTRGRGGARRTTPAVHSRYGIWESVDGGATWNLIQEVKDTNGATDLELDPQNPQILYSSFWGDAIYKSTDGGAHWAKAMNGLPAGDFAGPLSRFSISVSHPSAATPAVLYTGFDWDGATGHQAARVFKSTDGAASWTMLPAGSGADAVEDYCAEQCFYDNVIEADPTNPDVVFAAGQFNYGIGSGGIFRSDDGGQTWRNLGYDQHPDFHAVAFNPANTQTVIIGSDGGVWWSPDRGGRASAASPLSAVTWQNLNGTVNPATAGVLGRSNLSIAQFTSIATVPQIPPAGSTGSGRFWGGTQDNGTIRKTGSTGQQWFDVASGDGGQVLVDPTPESCVLGPACHVYGTYFGISPYRYTDGGNFFTNQYIRSGINRSDRSDFYTPFVLNLNNVNQLYLGTYRLYRTDNAKATSAGDVKWNAISGDLTSGCTGIAPNGARNCTISAIGVGGGQGVYTGSLDGYVYVAPDGQVSSTPAWTRVGRGELPNRPVSAFAVDRSNYRIAYAAYGGFNAATPSRPGHVFRTLDGGGSWSDVTGNLPDSPVNSIVLDPSFPNTLYAGTDVGPFVTYDGGATWLTLGTDASFPLVAVWQLNLDPSHRVLAAGTHGRGAYYQVDATSAPALVVSKVDAGDPVGPSSNVTYTLTLKNIGNAAATAVTLTDPVPASTSFVSADSGGAAPNGVVTWSGLTLPAGSSVVVHFTVSIAAALKNKVDAIVNDGVRATAAGGFGTTGSPFVTPIAPPYAVNVAPAAQTDGGRVGTSVSYLLTIRNRGFNADKYGLSATSGWATSFYDSTCTTPLATTATIAAGGSVAVCAKVAVPAAAANAATNTATLTATSVGSPGVSASATVTTIAVAVDTLLVDNDDNNPDVQASYKAALTAAGVPFSTWDLGTDKNLPTNYVKAFKNVVWFTGNSYPGPITPYEATLKAFLDGGGRLLMSGQDLLDQAAGTTAFVHDYLHVTWDGSEAQNDKATTAVHGVAGSPVSNGIGAVPIDHSVLGAAFEDRITPNGGALSAFTDDSGAADALTYSGTYKVVFLAFPLESYGTAADRGNLVTRTMTFFGP